MNPRYATISSYRTPTGSSGGNASPVEAGRMKTEQVVVEFLYKVTELVLQSRVHLQSEGEHGRSHRRARFNLDIEEIQFIRESMGAWKDDVHLPLMVDIYWDGERDKRVLLERWTVAYVATPSSQQQSWQDSHDSHLTRRHSSPINSVNAAAVNNTRDVIQQLKEVCKKIAVLLRALHSFMRQLPAHRFFRESYPSTLAYEIHADHPESQGFPADIATNQYSFIPIQTPFGYLKVSALYRRNCSALNERRRTSGTPIFQDNFIIQDYVPNSPDITITPSPETAMSPRYLGQPLSPTRRRSSPNMVQDTHRSKNTSQPMAIPQQAKPIEEKPAASSLEADNRLRGLHPHSYADPDRLRAVPANPNVTPAPYGYGNVAIEQGTPPQATGSSTSAHPAGHASGFSGSFQDHPSSSPHPLSTPPRHPNSILTPRTSRMSFLSTSAGKKTSGTQDYAYRASLENFSLDGTVPGGSHHKAMATPSPPSPSPLMKASGRAHTFHFSTRHSEGATKQASPLLQAAVANESSPHMTPPFMAESPPIDPGQRRSLSSKDDPSGVSSTALALQRASLDGRDSDAGIAMFTSSPPFQANPAELLSTSPGYSYGKHFQQYRRSPTFASTDHALARSSRSANGSEGGSPAFVGSTPPSVSNSMTHSKTHTFSTDVHENGAGIWGISPDSPDAFGFAIAGSTRRRLLSLSAEKGGSSAQDASTPEATDDDHELDLLPFAMGDGDHTSTTTTITATSSVIERPSFTSSTDIHGSSVGWDTASVGSFLQQLKNAPRLQVFEGNDAQPNAAQASDPTPDDQFLQTSFFDDELESFRSLRDELAHEL
ncbi:hypothetical protein Poli38472_004344 [Pythium oligandrum]|uniref:Autophagy-related protein 13 N-terminal domain-containing protein n=1 Tax=Pythium oligandrum TaxID=41045 RepID=A0A8K1CA25_PYTOL|nr:hypothetical protein Poli38472_004344 [Pythium oligandrum]|eukprot:TMW59275.1 hypothetical protein Poli38472_004344 [Pythium oligandrum]